MDRQTWADMFHMLESRGAIAPCEGGNWPWSGQLGCRSLAQWQRGLVAHLLQGEAAADFFHAGYGCELLQNEFFERAHVGNGHPDQVVGVAGHQVALHHLVVLRNAALKLGERGFGLLFEADGNEHIQPQAQRLRLGQRHIALDHAARLKRLDPVQAG